MKRINTLLLTIVACIATMDASAQEMHDITDHYLANAGFDTRFDYTIDDTGNVAQEILDVDGWTKNISVNYTITGV